MVDRGIVTRRVLPMAVAVMALAAVVLMVVRRANPVPEWKQYLQDLAPRTTNPAWQSSMGHQVRRMHLRNDLDKMSLWTVDEAEELIGYIEGVPLDSPAVTDDMPKEQYEAKWFSEDALNSVFDRIRVGAPIEPEARTRLIEVVLRRSYASDPFIRLGMANQLCSSGLIFEDKRCNDRTIELLDDPDPEVAMNARRHYMWNTATPEARERIHQIGGKVADRESLGLRTPRERRERKPG